MKDEEIWTWAREELGGQEPILNRSDITRIKQGEADTVFLRPRKPGFFLPDGSFVESFDYSPDFGDDLADASKRWEGEEANRKWADAENELFNKSNASRSPELGRLMWEHGRRIVERAEASKCSPSRLLVLLDRRGSKESYRRHTHQTSVDFYRWKPNLSDASGLFGWKWERIDAVIRFSLLDAVRAALTRAIEDTELGLLPDDQLSRVLGVKKRRQDASRTGQQQAAIDELRATLKRGLTPPPGAVRAAIQAVRAPSQSDPAGESDERP